MALRTHAAHAELTPDPGPSLPRNWYLVAPTASLRPGDVVERTLGAMPLVLWRARRSGVVSAFAAQCAHMGCHLSSACVKRDTLECALHHRRIDASGQFLRGPGDAYDGLTQRAYPVQEYLGGVFVHTGPTAEPLLLVDPSQYTTRFAREVHFPVPWQPIVANGFDVEHLAAVHDRELLAPPVITHPSASEFRLQYQSRPVIRTFSDRVMAVLARGGIRATIRSLSGTMMLVESQIGARSTFILMSFSPDQANGTIIRSIVGVRGTGLLQGRLASLITRVLFESFLKKDIGVLRGLRWHEPLVHHTDGDRYTRQLCTFFRELPGA
jgi:aminopyrrolnitrin oxygenase